MSDTAPAHSPSPRRSVCLLDKRCRRGELARQHVDTRPVDERRGKYGQCAGVARVPDHVGGQLMPRLVVPQFAGGGFLHDGERQRHPAQGLAVGCLAVGT